MAHPTTHAQSSARRYGGVPDDYIEIHDFMDSSKAVFPDNRHRALTHHSWFIFVVEKCFGHEIDLTCVKCNGSGEVDVLDGGILPRPKDIPVPQQPCVKCDGTGKKGTAKVRYICEQHILEDFGGKYIPTAGDYLEGMEFQKWINNGVEGAPTSHRMLSREGKLTRRRAVSLD